MFIYFNHTIDDLKTVEFYFTLHVIYFIFTAIKYII